jgi:hypothetical protein
MLTFLTVLTILGFISATLIVAIVFANKFAVLCLSLLTAYLGTLMYLAFRGRKLKEPANQVVVLEPDYQQQRQMMLRRVS